MEGARLGPCLSYEFKKTVKPSLEESLDTLSTLFSTYLVGLYSREPLQQVVCVLEAPIVGVSTNRRVGVNMGAVCGALSATAMLNVQALVRIVPPAKWKKTVCGVGNLKKDGVMAWLEFNHPHLAKECRTDDDIDAMCLALYASKQEEVL